MRILTDTWLSRFAKRFTPRSLFGRALLILVVPVVLIQLVATYFFYERHWDSMVRNLSGALSGEVALLMDEFQRAAPETRVERVQRLGKQMGFSAVFDQSQTAIFVEGEGRDKYPEFYEALQKQIYKPFRIKIKKDTLRVDIQVDHGVISFRTNKKRLLSSTTSIFIYWMVGSSIVLLLIAVMFLRNQIRPIVHLSQAAELFGMGMDDAEYKPSGATEVRQAGRAFLTMRERIHRQVTTRVEMLAGISHDLRTPLTRMKLQLAMSGLSGKALTELQSDVGEMEHMIQEYLDFARGEGTEVPIATRIDLLLEEILESYQRNKQPVSIEGELPEALQMVRPKALRRAIENLVNNAIRYGMRARIRMEKTADALHMIVEDDGPGIPEAMQEVVFRPFKRLEESRNQQTGGVGLGLTIARDIVHGHGGTITLQNRADAEGKVQGLRMTISLPVQAQVT